MPADGATRIERDALGEVELPADALYGIQAARALENLRFSRNTLGSRPAYLHALLRVNRATARANAEAGVIDPAIADAIARAALALEAGAHADQFPVDLLGDGGSIGVHMNVSEVLAPLANATLAQVGASQSTADVCHVAARLAIRDLARPLESVWQQVLEDARFKRLKDRYQAADFHDLVGLPLPRLELVDFRRYRVKIIPTHTTRGCPYHCAFCEVPIVYGHTYRRRPLGEVIEEIKANVRITGLKNIYFIDDNLTGHRDYAKEMFQALMPLKLRWSCLWTINTSRDEELLDLAKRSGCSHVNIGIENVCQESIASIDKVRC